MDILIDILNLGESKTWIVYLVACLLSFMPFAILGFLFSKHRQEEPSYLLSLDRVKGLKNSWTLLVLLIAPLTFIYNVFVWSGYAFVVIANFIAYLIKSIYDLLVKYLLIHIWNAIKWLFNAIVWVFLNIIWMPIVIVFKSFYHYFILWIWDIYKTSFLALNGTYNKSKLRITFIGAFYALCILGVSIYLSILTGYEVLGIIGLVVSTLPTIKAYGTVTSMLHFEEDKDHVQHGSKVMKTALNYVVASVVAILAIELLLLFSWIPDLGLVFLGLAINTNVLLSAIVIVSLFVLFFAQAIFPNHLLYNEESTSMPDSIMSYLKSIRSKGVQLLLSTLPGSLWTLLVLLIPAALIYISVSTSESFKESTLNQRAVNIAEDIVEANEEVASLTTEFTQEQLSEVEDAFETAIELNVRSNQNNFGLSFPQNVIENPEIIFNDNNTEYTEILPSMLKGSINDTLAIAARIKKAELLIERITRHISEYMDQSWEFKVQRKNKKDGKDDWTTIASGTDISRIVDKNIIEGRSYVYRVMAINKNGKSSWSSQYSETIGSQSLASPSDLQISSESNFRLVFSWNDNSNNEDGFIIERRLSGKDGKWSEYASVGSDVSQHIVESQDVRSKHIRKYDYRVIAQGLGEKSKPTATKSFQLILDSPKKLKSNANLKSVLLDWAYRFGYDTKEWEWIGYNRRAGLITANKPDGIMVLGEKSLATIMQEKIDSEQELLIELNEEMTFAKQRVSMFESLISYDKSQRTMLKVFKNLAFLFAILFTALFGGIIVAIAMSYLASLFYKVYTIREEDSCYLMSLINHEKEKNKNQPLLAFTIWFLVILYFTDILANVSLAFTWIS